MKSTNPISQYLIALNDKIISKYCDSDLNTEIGLNLYTSLNLNILSIIERFLKNE